MWISLPISWLILSLDKLSFRNLFLLTLFFNSNNFGLQFLKQTFYFGDLWTLVIFFFLSCPSLDRNRATTNKCHQTLFVTGISFDDLIAEVPKFFFSSFFSSNELFCGWRKSGRVSFKLHQVRVFELFFSS